MRIIAVALVCLLATLFGVIQAGAAAIGGPCTSAISGPNDPDFARADYSSEVNRVGARRGQKSGNYLSRTRGFA